MTNKIESEKLNRVKVPYQSMDIDTTAEIPHFEDIIDFIKT